MSEPTRAESSPPDGPASAVSDPPAPPSGGPTVPGYEILGELGRGGMGVVYKARQQGLNRTVALKMLLAGAHAGAHDSARFRAEASTVARLQHPNIVQIYEVDEHAGLPYFSLEFCQGGSLDRRLPGTPLGPRQAAELVRALAQAMHAAHEVGIVHRDLKPGNVLFAADGTPKITDFGLAKRLDGTALHTASGAVLGTPSYMAPEQAAGKVKEVGAAADVYALGAILYECLTGRPPFRADTPVDTLRQVLHEAPVSPCRLQPKVPRDLDTVCLKCLQKEPKRRYASAAALADDLGRFLEGKPVAAQPVGAAERAWRWCRRNPAVAALAAAVSLSLLAGSGVATHFALEADARARDALLQKERADGEAARAEARAKQAEGERLNVRRHLYAAQMNLAQRAWSDRQVAQLVELLDSQRPERTGGVDLRGFEWHYWNRLCQASLLTIAGGTDGINARVLAYRPDGKALAGISDREEVKVWDPGTGRLLLSLRSGRGDATCVAYRPDGKVLATAAHNGAIRLWDAASGKLLRTLRARDANPKAAIGVHALAFSPDGKRLAAAGWQGAWVWDVGTGREEYALKEAGGLVAFSPDGKHLAAVSEGSVTVRDAATGREAFAFGKGVKVTADLAFSPDGKRLACPGPGRVVQLWDLTTREVAVTLRGLPSVVNSVAFSLDGKRLATGSGDYGEPGEVTVWDATTGAALFSLRGRDNRIQCVAFRPDGKRLATMSRQGLVEVWDATAGPEVLVVRGHKGFIFGFAMSPDGKHFATAAQDKEKAVRLWDAVTGRETRGFEVGNFWAQGVAFSPDSKLVAAACADQTVKVWEVATGREERTLRGADRFRGGVFSPDWKVLAAPTDRAVRLWDVGNGREIRALGGAAAAVRALAFSPDGKHLAASWEDGTVRVWEVASGQVRLTLKHTAPIGCLAVHPDGRLLAGGSEDNTVRVWDLSTGAVVHTLRGHTDGVSCLAFSPRGDRLASGSLDFTVRLWDLETGLETLTLKGHTFWVTGVAFTPDGHRLASASYDATVRVSDATPLPDSPRPAPTPGK